MLLRSGGTVLIVVIWITLILASLTIVLAHGIRVEAMAAANHVSQVKAEAVAGGAIHYVFANLGNKAESTVSYGASPFEAMQVGEGYFWILRPNLSESREYEFGLVDEAGKVNLNEASLEMMLKLPGMTSELANSMTDWRDEDQEVSVGGAEGEYYLLLSDPYQCKNAPLETMEEVLLVKGGDLELLYGEDTNRNGLMDWNENDGQNALPSDNSNGRLDPGFFNYATIHSYEMNISSQGQQRINVNRVQDRYKLAELLEETFGENKALKILSNVPTAPVQYQSLIQFYKITKMEYDEFVQIIDRLTVDSKEKIPGRININQAPEEVLLCLPGLEQSDVDTLIRERDRAGAELDSILWVTRVLEEEKAQAIGRFITTRSSQYSADIIAASGDGRAFCRYFVVIDTAQGTPAVVYKQSLHHLGWPLDPGILESLRQGMEL